MNIPDSLVRDFVKIAKEPVKTGGDSTLYGTVVSVSGSGSQREAMVLIDGAEMATPASLGMDAEQGDRVSVLVKNHEAIVNGNITSPASARTATKYMRFTEDGLKIGSFGSSGNPSGNYILITDNAYYIKNADDTTLLSVSSDGTRVVGPDGVLKASFLSGGTTLYSGGLMRLLLNSNGVTIYDPTGTKTMAKFLSSGIEIYNENGVITSKFDATGAVLLNPTANDNDGVRIYNGSQANAANLLASFVASGIKLHALVTSGGTTVNRTLAEFLNSGLKFYDQNSVLKMILDGDGIKLYKDANNYAANFLSDGTRLYNQNGKRTYLANADGIHLYDGDESALASFIRTGVDLYGPNEGVRIFDAPTVANVHARQLLASFKSNGIVLHALVTSNGTTVNRTLAKFLNNGLEFYNQNGVLQTKTDEYGLKLYNKDGEVTASFEDKGCVLYGRTDGIRIYDSPTVANVHTRQLLASFKSNGVVLHALVTSNGTTVNRTLAEFLNTGVNLYNQSGVLQTKMDTAGLKLYNKDGDLTAAFVDTGLKLYGRNDGIRIYDNPTSNKLLASFISSGVRIHGINSNNVNVILAEFLASGITLNRSDGTPMVNIGSGIIELTNANGNTCSALTWTSLGLADGLAQLYYDDADDVLDITCHGSVTINGEGIATQTQLATKASQSSVDTLADQYNNVVASLAQKASQSDLNSLATNVVSLSNSVAASISDLQTRLLAVINGLSSMVETGTVRATGTATAGHLTVFRANVTVSTGYVLTGIRDIKITNTSGNASIHYSLNQFAASDTAVQAWVYNDTASDASLIVDFEWTAVKNSVNVS